MAGPDWSGDSEQSGYPKIEAIAEEFSTTYSRLKRLVAIFIAICLVIGLLILWALL